MTSVVSDATAAPQQVKGGLHNVQSQQSILDVAKIEEGVQDIDLQAKAPGQMPISSFLGSCCWLLDIEVLLLQILYLLVLVSAAFQALFEKLTNGTSTADRKAAAQDVVEQMKAGGAASFAVSLLSAAVAGFSTIQPLHFMTQLFSIS